MSITTLAVPSPQKKEKQEKSVAAVLPPYDKDFDCRNEYYET